MSPKPPQPPHPHDESPEVHLPKHPRPPHDVPPHEKKRKFWGKRLTFSVIIGCGVTFILGVALWLFNIPTNTILPVLAPIWAGVTTLAYTAIGDRLT